MTCVLKTIKIVPEGKTLFSSPILTDKMQEMINSGDLVSRNLNTNGTYNLITSTYKDEMVYRNHCVWREENGINTAQENYEKENGIENFLSDKNIK